MVYGKHIVLPYNGGPIPAGYKLKRHGTVIKSKDRVSKDQMLYTTAVGGYVPMRLKIQTFIAKYLYGGI
jgi:hypothetical protein